MTSTAKPILAVGTMDSKGPEVAYVADCIRGTGGAVRTVDVGAAPRPCRTACVPT